MLTDADQHVFVAEPTFAGFLKTLVDLGAFVLAGSLARDLGHFLGPAGWAAHTIGPAFLLKVG